MLIRNFIRHQTFEYIKRQIFKVSFDRQSFCSSVCFVFFPSFFLFAMDLRKQSPEVFLGKDDLKTCSKFTGEHPCRSAISIKLQSNFIEITLRYGCSFVSLLHIFRTPFHKSISEGLLLKISTCGKSLWSKSLTDTYEIVYCTVIAVKPI